MSVCGVNFWGTRHRSSPYQATRMDSRQEFPATTIRPRCRGCSDWGRTNEILGT